MLRRSWVEINPDILVSNYNIYRSSLPEGTEIMAVVKADAYGHGEKEITSALQKNGCRHFAVSNIDEAIQLRKNGITGRILILGYTPVSSASDLVRYDITQALLSEEYAEMLADKGITAEFAVDTGMNRIGLDADDPEKCRDIIFRYSSRYNLTGIFTHLCTADSDDGTEFANEQIGKFDKIAKMINRLRLPYIHCMNSAGGMRLPKYGNLVRLGIIMYGLKPDYSNTLPEGIKPCLKWKSVVSMIKTVRAGESIGYGRTFTAEKDMTVATIPTGYADGYSRNLSNKGFVIVRNKKAPVIGRVCMDQMMVDVTDIPDVMFEDEVTLLGEEYNADDMARDIGTIGYEVICDIGKRVPRIYILNEADK